MNREKPGDGLKRLRQAFLPPEINAVCVQGKDKCNTPRACRAAGECCYARYHKANDVGDAECSFCKRPGKDCP